MPTASPRRQPPVIRRRDRRRADGRPHSARHPGPGPSSAARTRAGRARRMSLATRRPRRDANAPVHDAPQPRSMVGASGSLMPAARAGASRPSPQPPACGWDARRAQGAAPPSFRRASGRPRVIRRPRRRGPSTMHDQAFPALDAPIASAAAGASRSFVPVARAAPPVVRRRDGQRADGRRDPRVPELGPGQFGVIEWQTTKRCSSGYENTQGIRQFSDAEMGYGRTIAPHSNLCAQDPKPV
jgi:hypothetical protein